jgi:endonuclease YncB( thermonuclease family)
MRNGKWILIGISGIVALGFGFSVSFGTFSLSGLPAETPISNSNPTPNIVYPAILSGKVIGLNDGDTVTILTSDNQQFRIRLSGIDSPEMKQDFGQKSKANLSDLVFGKDVKVNASKIDKYGRTLGQIFIGDLDICLQQIADGLAWHYKKYEDEQSATDRKLYSDAEAVAQKAKRGLWSSPNPVPPWVFRHPEIGQ